MAWVAVVVGLALSVVGAYLAVIGMDSDGADETLARLATEESLVTPQVVGGDGSDSGG